jgi:hypothetical protein
MNRGSKRTLRAKFLALLVILLVLVLTSFSSVKAIDASEYYTCKGVQYHDPWGYIGKTSEFLTSDTMAFAWVKLRDITKSYRLEFRWSEVNEVGTWVGEYTHDQITTDPHSQGSDYWQYYITWDYIPIATGDAIGRWRITMSVDGTPAFTLEFTVKKDTNLVERTETVLLSSTITSTATATTIVTSTAQYSLASSLPFPLYILTIAGLIAVSSYSEYRWGRDRKPTTRQLDEPLAEYLAKLEELRSRNEISQVTYERLKDEYWARIKGSIDHDK